MENRKFDDRKEPEIVYSRSVKAGKRIYYLDVKKARNEDLYVCITESKKKSQGEDVAPSFEKHKLFLYKEDFNHFVEGLEDVVNYVKNELGEFGDREERPMQPASEEEPAQVEAEESVAVDAPEEGEKPRRFGFFGLRK